MKKTVIFSSVLLGLAVASCDSREELPAAAGSTVIIANAGTGTAVSRSAIDPTEYSGGDVGLLWTQGDELGVFGGGTVNARFVTTATEPAGRAAFTGDCPSPEYAYYPYSAANDGRAVTALTGSLAPEQSYSEATGEIEGDYKYGRLRNNAENEFDFTHIFALLKFNVEAGGTELAGERLRSVSLALPEGRRLAGDFIFDATDGWYEIRSNISSTVTVKWSDSPRLEAGQRRTAYMSVAPDMKADDEVTVTVVTDGHKATFTKHIAYDFEANAVYTFDLELKKYAADMTVEELPAEAEEETANCYMITAAGEHDFKATVIGNGQKGIIPGAGFHTDDATIDPVSAKLLWEDVNGFITDVTLTDGRVHYRTTGNVGNAVIAVYDGPAATGNILWSWHIWGVGDTLPETYSYTTKGGVVNEIMDRDLGAFPATDEQRLQTERTEADEACVLHAMLYQWGRKDPMPNSPVRYVDGAEADLTSFPVWKGSSSEDYTIEASIRHPAELISSYGSTSKRSWLATDVPLLWGDDVKSGSDASGRWTDVKTIYDPSPVGYRVPNYYTFNSFLPGSETKNSITLKGVMSFNTTQNVPSLSTSFNCVIETVLDGTTERWLPKGIHMSRIGVSAEGTPMYGYGVYVKRSENDTEGSFYPACGYLFPNSETDNRTDYGTYSYRWLSCGINTTLSKGNLQLTHFYWRSGNSTDDAGLPSGTGGGAGVWGNVKTQNGSDPWCAYAVRCVRDVR